MTEMTPDLAEACGIHAGDGYLRGKYYRKELDISGNYEEQGYYDNYVIPLFENLFKIKIQGRKFLSRGTYGFVIRDKNVINFFHQLGFPYGAKSSIVKAPVSVLESKNPKVYAGFLRGLLDTDGSISFRKNYGKYTQFKTTRHHYPHIMLNTVSPYLALDMGKMLEHLGMNFYYYKYHPKQNNLKEVNIIFINGVKRVNKWMDLIGSKNPVKLSRYLIWKKLGFCPTHTTFEEREEILKGTLDVHSLMGPIV